MTRFDDDHEWTVARVFGNDFDLAIRCGVPIRLLLDAATRFARISTFADRLAATRAEGESDLDVLFRILDLTYDNPHRPGPVDLWDDLARSAVSRDALDPRQVTPADWVLEMNRHPLAFLNSLPASGLTGALDYSIFRHPALRASLREEVLADPGRVSVFLIWVLRNLSADYPDLRDARRAVG